MEKLLFTLFNLLCLYDSVPYLMTANVKAISQIAWQIMFSYPSQINEGVRRL